jgi:hypothetical protein
MDTVAEILRSSSNGVMVDDRELASCLAACGDCAFACVACADACLGESELPDLRKTIRLNLDCADICESAARVLSRQLEPEMQLVDRLISLLSMACRLCAEECAWHEKIPPCRLCAEACRRCEQACESLQQAMLAH